eukprot:COSAG06_NODE_1361_length_9704_cov_16.768974_2_plen_271_part_00
MVVVHPHRPRSPSRCEGPRQQTPRLPAPGACQPTSTFAHTHRDSGKGIRAPLEICHHSAYLGRCQILLLTDVVHCISKRCHRCGRHTCLSRRPLVLEPSKANLRHQRRPPSLDLICAQYSFLVRNKMFQCGHPRCGTPDVAPRCGTPDVAPPMWHPRCGPPYVAESEIRFRHIGTTGVSPTDSDLLRPVLAGPDLHPARTGVAIFSDQVSTTSPDSIRIQLHFKVYHNTLCTKYNYTLDTFLCYYSLHSTGLLRRLLPTRLLLAGRCPWP